MRIAVDTAGVHVVHADSFDAWREAARVLLLREVAPHGVSWVGELVEPDLLAAPVLDPGDEHAVGQEQGGPNGARPAAVLRIPRQLVDMLAKAACYRATDRWAFLYKVVWRWQHGEKDVGSAADEDGARLHAMVKAVRREEHDMHAYLRFRERLGKEGPPRFVAWYEPAHDVLPQVARHFADRMGGVTWMIATPDATMLWDGATLHAAPPCASSPARIDDAGEALWLSYYRSTFNPSRLNTRLMQSHIPSRFWKNLPEGRVVPEMVAAAAAGARRTGQAQSVGQRGGKLIPVNAERAVPLRAEASQLDRCRRCELWQKSTQAVPGSGPQDARIMLLGEQPGDEEDIAGQPFVGPAGQLLNRALAQAGLDRGSLYITNAVKHFKWEPRGKRRLHKTPAQREIAACNDWLQGELDTVRPTVVVVLGSTAMKSLVGSSQSFSQHLGEAFMHQGRWTIVLYHPAYVLRLSEPKAKQQAYALMVSGLARARDLASYRLA